MNEKNITDAGAMLEDAQMQLATTQTDLLRMTHNIQALITNLEKVVVKLMEEGGGSEW